MIVRHSAANPPPEARRYEDRMDGPDKGIINAWLAGLAKRREALTAGQSDALSWVRKAEADELPVLPYRGGLDAAIKRQDKIGSLLYLAMWQGLRGNDLLIDMATEPVLVCSRTGVPVLFTLNIEKLLGTAEIE